MKRSISVLLIFVLLFSVLGIVSYAEETVPDAPIVAEGTCGVGVKWTLDGAGVLCISGNGAMDNYESGTDVPWHDYQSDILSVVIDGGVESVGDYAFYYCENLSSVSLPDGVTYIGAYSFSKCYSLSGITVPNGVASIGRGAFEDSYKLKKVKLGSGLETVGEDAFASCTSVTEIVIPDSVTEIGACAFYNCVALETLSLPENLETLGEAAFESCLSLETVTIPDKVSEIRDNTFFCCLSLRTVFVGQGVKTIGNEAFLWCDSLEMILLPDGLESIGSHAIGYYYFGGKYVKVQNLDIVASEGTVGSGYTRDNSFTHIISDDSHVCDTKCEFCGKCVNYDCKYYTCYDKCTEHSFPMSGTCGDDARWLLEENGRLTISGTGDIYDFGYNGAPWYIVRKAVKNIEIGENITCIGNYAFNDCYNVRSVSLPRDLDSIGFKAFYGCEMLSEISFPEGLETIGDYAFARCLNIVNVEIPDSVLTIGRYAFYKCPLSSVEIGGGVKSIGEFAFEAGDRLKSITIPQNVEYIGERFAGFYYKDGRYIKIDGFTVYGEKDSAASAYAEQYGFDFVIYPWINPFDDVKEGSWYFDAVKYTNSRGLFGGVSENRFEPGSSVTRGMLVTVLWRAEGSPKPSGGIAFDDVKDGKYYAEAVAWASENNIVNGTGYKKFEPESNVSREQISAMLFRYAGYKKNSADVSADISVFPDSEQISDWALESMAWACGAGIIKGKSSGDSQLLEPAAHSTRAEVATMLMRFKQTYDG